MIPGARNAFWRDNLTPDGGFLPPARLRERFDDLLAGSAPQEAIAYCGSGVTGAHLLLAMAYAGLAHSRLYAGSWSEWICEPDRPIQRGTSLPGVSPGA